MTAENERRSFGPPAALADYRQRVATPASDATEPSGFDPGPPGGGIEMERRVTSLEKDAHYARCDLDRHYDLLLRMDGKLDGLSDKIGGIQTKLLLAGFAAIAIICGFVLGGFVWLHNLMMTVLQIIRV